MLLAGAVLLGGCGSRHEAAPTTTITATKSAPTVHRPTVPAHGPRRPTAVQVTVVDGDTNRAFAARASPSASARRAATGTGSRT